MKKFLTVVLFALGLVVALAAPTYAVAQEDAILTDYDYSRLSFGNAFANQKAKPILRNADRAIHAPVSTLALLASIEYGARYQGMMVNVDNGMYFYDATDCPSGSTSPTAVAPDDTVGCWYLMSGSADIWAALADTTPTSGASLIGIKDTATYYTGTNIEDALAELGLSRTTSAELVDTPIVGNFLSTDALGQPVMLAYAPNDFALASSVVNKFLSTGNMHDVVDDAIAGVSFPAAPADGYRLFCTADGDVFVEGKIYQYTAGTTNAWDTGENLLAGEIVQTRNGDLIIGGTTLTDSVKLSDFATDTDLNTRITTIVDTAADTAPADPGIDGYRVFMTNTDGGLDEGKIYVWDDTGNVWDAGTQLADGQIVASKGSSPDMIVGGTDPTDYEALSEKLDRNSLACKDITVALSTNTGTVAADPDWIDAYYLSASPVSGADKVVASVVIAGDGAITVTLAAASTAEAVYRVCAILD